MDAPAATALLRERGLRVTAARLAVLDALRGSPHATADELVRAVRERTGAISTQAVYDILHALDGAELVRRIQPAGSPARFETRVGDNHHHLVCRGCGATVDVECAVGAAPCLSPAEAAGYEVEEAEVIFWGRCAACRSTRRKDER
jgi:Fe2+ or Zn2+ uptake regulation protein